MQEFFLYSERWTKALNTVVQEDGLFMSWLDRVVDDTVFCTQDLDRILAILNTYAAGLCHAGARKHEGIYIDIAAKMMNHAVHRLYTVYPFTQRQVNSALITLRAQSSRERELLITAALN